MTATTLRTYAPTPDVARVFLIPPCTRCRKPLGDRDGNPRWEIAGFGEAMRFVCLDGCREVGGRA